jgi:hypothetical protein
VAPDVATVCGASDGDGAGQCPAEARLVDINDQAFLMRSDRRIGPPFPTRFTLATEMRRGGRVRRKVAKCTGVLYRETVKSESEYDYVVEYQCVTPLNYYVVQQYFLLKSFA